MSFSVVFSQRFIFVRLDCWVSCTTIMFFKTKAEWSIGLSSISFLTLIVDLTGNLIYCICCCAMSLSKSCTGPAVVGRAGGFVERSGFCE